MYKQMKTKYKKAMFVFSLQPRFFIYDCGETAQDTQMLLKLVQIDMVGKTISVFKRDTCFLSSLFNKPLRFHPLA